MCRTARTTITERSVKTINTATPTIEPTIAARGKAKKFVTKCKKFIKKVEKLKTHYLRDGISKTNSFEYIRPQAPFATRVKLWKEKF